MGRLMANEPNFDIYQNLDRDIRSAQAGKEPRQPGLGEIVMEDIGAKWDAAPQKPPERKIDLNAVTGPDQLQDALEYFAAKNTYEIYTQAEEAEQEVRERSQLARDRIIRTSDLDRFLESVLPKAEKGEFDKVWSEIDTNTGTDPVANAKKGILKIALQPALLDWAKNSVSQGKATDAMDLVENFRADITFEDLLHKAMDYDMLTYLVKEYKGGDDTIGEDVYDLLVRYGLSDEDKEKILSAIDPYVFAKARETIREDPKGASELILKNTSSVRIRTIMFSVLGE